MAGLNVDEGRTVFQPRMAGESDDAFSGRMESARVAGVNKLANKFGYEQYREPTAFPSRQYGETGDAFAARLEAGRVAGVNKLRGMGFTNFAAPGSPAEESQRRVSAPQRTPGLRTSAASTFRAAGVDDIVNPGGDVPFEQRADIGRTLGSFAPQNIGNTVKADAPQRVNMGFGTMPPLTGNPNANNPTNFPPPPSVPISVPHAVQIGLENGLKAWRATLPPAGIATGEGGTSLVERENQPVSVPGLQGTPWLARGTPEDAGTGTTGGVITQIGPTRGNQSVSSPQAPTAQPPLRMQVQQPGQPGINLQKPSPASAAPVGLNSTPNPGGHPRAIGYSELDNGDNRYMFPGGKYVDISQVERGEISNNPQKYPTGINSYIDYKLGESPEQAARQTGYDPAQDTAAQAAARETQTATGGGRGQGLQGLDAAGLKGKTFNGNPLQAAYDAAKKQPSFQEFADISAARSGPGGAGGIALRERARRDIQTREANQLASNERNVAAQAGAVAAGASAKAMGKLISDEDHNATLMAVRGMDNTSRASIAEATNKSRGAWENARNERQRQDAANKITAELKIAGMKLKDSQARSLATQQVKYLTQINAQLKSYGIMPPQEGTKEYANYSTLLKRQREFLDNIQAPAGDTEGDTAGGESAPAPTAAPATTELPPVLTPEQARALKPGTQFRTQDGRTLTR